VISSVAGGVGLTVAEYLSKMGYANIYGIAGSDEKCKAAKEVGCKDTINYRRYYSGD
jgi:NADPH-dependent curcumin reductase CurA